MNIAEMTDHQIEREIERLEKQGAPDKIPAMLGHLKHARNMREARKIYERRKRDNGLD